MALFEPAFEYLMDDEDRQRKGNIVPDPTRDNSQALARFGINSAAHPELLVKGFFAKQPDGSPVMEHDRAYQMAADTYKYCYFAAICGYSIVSQDVVNKYFDLAVNEGPREATKILQRAINKTLYGTQGFVPLTIDGKCGQQTVEAANQCAPEELLAQYKAYSVEFYRAWAFANHKPDSLRDALIARVNR